MGTQSQVELVRETRMAQVTSSGNFRYANSKWFARALASLVCTGVRGVAIDVWVRRSPRFPPGQSQPGRPPGRRARAAGVLTPQRMSRPLQVVLCLEEQHERRLDKGYMQQSAVRAYLLSALCM